MLIDTLSLENRGDVHLWITYTADYLSSSTLEQCESLLDQAELIHYRELANPDHRREYAISRAFLRQILAGYCQCDARALQFESNQSGKPRLAAAMNSDVSFNVSHGVDFMACAVTSSELIGVDVETFSPDTRMVDVADHYFSVREMENLEGLSFAEQQQLFFRTWTLKEAYIKARGEGLSLPLDSFSFDCTGDGSASLDEPEGNSTDWSFWSLQPVDGQIIALAVNTDISELRVFPHNSQGVQQELPLTSPGPGGLRIGRVQSINPQPNFGKGPGPFFQGKLRAGE